MTPECLFHLPVEDGPHGAALTLKGLLEVPVELHGHLGMADLVQPFLYKIEDLLLFDGPTRILVKLDSVGPFDRAETPMPHCA
jgi:hypothetical protein